jgi:RimK family alpha-L-glutamate ligase
MKIALISTFPEADEAKRIVEEATKQGHTCDVHNFYNVQLAFLQDGLVINNVKDWNYDLIIVRGVFNSIKAVGALINYWRSKGIKVFDNNISEHQYAINKVADLVKLAVAELPLPETYYSRDYKDFKTFAEKLGFPFVLKSTRTGQGSGVFKMDSDQQLEEFIKNAKESGKKAKDFLLQEMIPYVHDLRILILGNHQFVMKRIPGEGEFRANFSLGGSVELFELDEEGKKMAQKALEAIDMSIAGVDMLITADNKRYILEVNHTAGFMGMEQATGENIAKIFLEVAMADAK